MTEITKTSQTPTFGLILLLGSLTAFPAISTDVYLPALPAMTADLRTTPNAAALTLSAFFLGMAIGQFLFGPWSDRVGRRKPLLIGIGIYIAAGIGCAFAQSIELLIALRFVQAFGGCAAVTITRAIVRDKFDAQSTARVLSHLMLVFGAAPIFGPIFGGALLLFADWRIIFLFLALFGVVCGLCVYFFLPESLDVSSDAGGQRETVLQSVNALAIDPVFVAYALVCGFAGGTILTYVALSPDLFVQGFGMTAQEFSFLFSLNGAGLVAASQLNVVLLRGVAYQRVLRIATLCSVGVAFVLFFLAFSAIGGVWGIGIPLFLIITGMGFIGSNAMAGALAAQSHRAGAASSFVGASWSIGAAIAIALGGALYDGSGRAMAAVMLTCASLGALALRALPGLAQMQARAAASTAALKPESENS